MVGNIQDDIHLSDLTLFRQINNNQHQEITKGIYFQMMFFVTVVFPYVEFQYLVLRI